MARQRQTVKLKGLPAIRHSVAKKIAKVRSNVRRGKA